LDLVLRYTHHDKLAAGCKTGHQWPHRITNGGCGKNRSGPAHTLQYRYGIVDGSIDVDVRAQLFRKRFLLPSTPDRDSTESHLARKLDTKMPEATNTLHSDQISAAQAGVAKRVVGRDTRAEERGGLCGPELIRNGRDAARFSDHYFRISSIHGDSRYHGVLTMHHVAASAWIAHPIFAAEEADTDPLTDCPSRHSAAYGVNAPNNFVPRNARQSQTRVHARDRGSIGVTDSTCFYAHSNLTGARFGYGALDDAKTAWR
jgi:hypothetical protein